MFFNQLGSSKDHMFFFFLISQLFDAVGYSNYVFLGFRKYNFQTYNVQNLEIMRITTFPICNVVYQAGSRRDPSGFLMFYVLHLNNVIFWALSAGHFSNLQRSEPGNNKNNNIPHL
jgi:hypothetical protein